MDVYFRYKLFTILNDINMESDLRSPGKTHASVRGQGPYDDYSQMKVQKYIERLGGGETTTEE
jgi:hypothetical protein